MWRPQGGWRQREGGSGRTRDLTEVPVEGVDKAGWAAEDWLVWIVPARLRARPRLCGTCPGWRGQVDSGPECGSPVEEGEGGGWTLGWLVCLGKVCSQVSCLLSLGTSPSWEGQFLPRCDSIRPENKGHG